MTNEEFDKLDIYIGKEFYLSNGLKGKALGYHKRMVKMEFPKKGAHKRDHIKDIGVFPCQMLREVK